MSKPERKTDLFTFFDRMNNGRYDYVDSLTDEEIKTLSPYVLTMWSHGASTCNDAHVILTDLYCNDKVFSLSKHPRLLLKLFIAANSDMGSTRYKFIKSTGRDEAAVYGLIARHYHCTYSEARDIRALLNDDDVKTLKEMYGDI